MPIINTDKNRTNKKKLHLENLLLKEKKNKKEKNTQKVSSISKIKNLMDNIIIS